MKKILASLLCLCMLLAAAPVLAEEGEAVYRSLYGSEVSTLNYLTASTQWDQTVGANVIDTLVEYNNVGEIIPGLAESWEVSEDQLTWTFHLRAGQKWYDYQGNEVADVTAQDFVDALKYVLTASNESGVEYAVETANIVNAKAYYASTSAPAEGEEAPEPVDFATVGVKAVDALTLQYTLEAPVPYFLSCLTYGCFMPAYGPQLEELGAEFGTSNDKMYYNGAFIMTGFEPQVQHTYVKNANNWDAEHVYIDRIERYYNSESGTLSPEMALRGEVDTASISNDILEDWENEHGDILTRERADVAYSYFYCFNFDPQYEAEYDPANWLIAVNNSNFRHAIMSGFDRIFAMYALEPVDPEASMENTVTPPTFASVNGVDFSALPEFDGIEANFYNTEKALAYKAAAVEELTAAGVTFPVQVVLTYKSGDTDWESECQLVKQQLEEVLGADFISVQLYAGPSESFLSATRRAGKYSIMRCNWGADYADPETWTDPFAEKFGDDGKHAGNSYNKMDMMLDGDFEETKAFLTEYYAAVADAKASVSDTADRYAKFAKAEAMLINNAIVIPYKISSADYQITKLNVFEGEYAPFGMSNIRFKYQHLNDDFVTSEDYEAAYEAWKEAMGM